MFIAFNKSTLIHAKQVLQAQVYHQIGQYLQNEQELCRIYANVAKEANCITISSRSREQF